MRSVILVALGAALSCTQTVPEFEAASIKAQKPVPIDPLQPDSVIAGLQIMRGGPGTASPGRIHYSHVTLMSLIMKAYDLHADQVVGPRWLLEDHYAVDAIVPSGATREQFLEMLRNLLVSRFKLAVQWEERDFKVYRLVIGQGGAKLKPSAVSEAGDDQDNPLSVQVMAAKAGVDSRGCPVLPPSRRAAIGRNACMTYVGWSIPELAQMTLAMAIGNETGKRSWAHVIDETGLIGRFDFNLEYDVAYHAMMNSPAPVFGNLNTRNPVSIFKAVEMQLGLKLEPVTAKLKAMVIQQVERTPTEN
jgi:uncharacterized protein (TIGR03435 family)